MVEKGEPAGADDETRNGSRSRGVGGISGSSGSSRGGPGCEDVVQQARQVQRIEHRRHESHAVGGGDKLPKACEGLSGCLDGVRKSVYEAVRGKLCGPAGTQTVAAGEGERDGRGCGGADVVVHRAAPTHMHR